MAEARAKLRYYRQSPKKVRQVADSIRGISVPTALAQLQVLPKRASKMLYKLLMSAVANAENREGDSKLSREDLIVKEITVDQGPTYKRFMPRAHGRATMLRKKTSHILIVLGEKTNGKEDKELKEASTGKTAAKATKTTTKKTESKKETAAKVKTTPKKQASKTK